MVLTGFNDIFVKKVMGSDKKNLLVIVPGHLAYFQNAYLYELKNNYINNGF